MSDMTRRQFLMTTAIATAGLGFVGTTWAEQEAAKTASLVVVKGKDCAGMLAAGIEKLGGWKAFVKPGGKVTLKVNAAWVSTPEQGGNTDPDLAGACVASCLAAGAGSVVLPENPCNNAEEAFETSGIRKAVKKAGGKIYSPGDGDYRSVELPGATKLKTADVVKDVLDTDCLINMPVAKSHGGAIVTISMKNWMGSVKDRGFWHKNNLHQCIVDFSTFVKPSLIVVDATRVMLTDGPRGPGKMAYPGELIFGTDPVAVDAYATTLLGKQPFDIPYIKLAHDMGLGCGDLDKVAITRIEA